MDGLLVILGLVALAWFFLPFMHISSIRGLKAEVADLRRRIGLLEGGAVHTARPEPAGMPQPVRPAMQDDEARRDDARMAAVAARARHEEKVQDMPRPQDTSPPPSPPRGGLEFNLTARLPVWIGAVALACAAFYLVRYSIEAGWFSPAVRVIGGGLFGAVLTVAGDRIGRAGRIANGRRIAQGLVGAGLAALYGAFYAAVSVYEFLPPVAGVLCMTAVTMGAVVMALRHGQPIAIFGLAAGILTPALVGSDTPQAALLFGHLFVVFAFGLTVLARQGWWVLAGAALAGLYAWCGLWLAEGGGEERVLILFVMALAGAVTLVTARRGESQAAVLNAAAIAGAALMIAFMDTRIELGVFEWGMMAVLSAGLLALAYMREESYRALLLCKAALDMAVLYMWGQDADVTGVLALVAVFAALYVGVPQYMMTRVRDPRFWALAQGGAAAALYAVAYECVPGLADAAWAGMALGLAALAVLRVRVFMRDASATGEHMTAIYTAGAVGFTVTALSIVLPGDVLAATLAAKAAILLWLHRRTDIAALPPLALAVAAGVLIVLADPVADVTERAGDALLQTGGVLQGLRGGLVTDFLLPGVALLGGAMLYQGESRVVRHGFYGFALLLLAGFAYYGTAAVAVEPFVRGGLFSAVAGLGGIALVYRGGETAAWGRALVGFAVARIVYLDMLVANPYFERSLDVGALPVFNGVTLAYGAGALLCLYAAASVRMELGQGARNIYKALGFAMLFALVTLNVRQAAQGGVLAGGAMGDAELYGYSAAWLVTGLALLGYGMRAGSRAAHIASGLFIALAVGKVFLFDAAALDGLARVFSFLGLGVSLMGLSVFYTRHARRRDGRDEKWGF